jgi:hypothetical protein
MGPRLRRRLLTYTPGDEDKPIRAIDHQPGGRIGHHGADGTRPA